MMKVYSAEVGVAVADVTPKPGIHLTGYAVREGAARGGDESLALSVLALRGADEMVLIVAVDLCLADIEHTNELRRTCGEVVGIDASNVLVNFNHTHSAPSIGIYIASFPDAQRSLHRDYWASLLATARGACRKALESMIPARFASGVGECHGNVNRRQHSPDGGIVLGENPMAHVILPSASSASIAKMGPRWRYCSAIPAIRSPLDLGRIKSRPIISAQPGP